jgi:predicted nucleic acid-binding protein
MSTKYTLDSNVIIDYQSGRIPTENLDFIKGVLDDSFNISIIVKIEVLGFNDTPEEMQLMEELVTRSRIISIDDTISDRTIMLRRQPKKIKLWDAIIASTAIESSSILITHNISDFRGVSGLTILDPYTMLLHSSL